MHNAGFAVLLGEKCPNRKVLVDMILFANPMFVLWALMAVANDDASFDKFDNVAFHYEFKE